MDPEAARRPGGATARCRWCRGWGPPECVPPAPGEPILVTGDCVDPRFDDPSCSDPVIRTDPVDHYHVACEFVGTDARFTITCPMADDYEGRIFQSTHPLYNDPTDVPANDIAFGVDSGACFVRTNMGGSEQSRTPEDTQEPGFDAALGGYRVNAEAQKHAEVVAKQLYGDHDPYGYLYGGSGGAYQTICSAEHTRGVWDGYVPFVLGHPNSIPSNFTVRIHALRVLRQRNKFPEILDAIDPGGSGDPTATLNQEEAEAYLEAKRLGFPPRGWWNHPTLTGGPLALVAGYVPLLDGSYFDDFWSLPGHLGFDDPFGSVAAARVQQQTAVAAVQPIPGFPGAFVLPFPDPTADLTGADLVVLTGDAAGETIPLFGSLPAPLPPGVVLVAAQFNADPSVVARVAPGDAVVVDNSRYLALQTYHRHQVPEEEDLPMAAWKADEFVGWDQFEDADGDPIYPQRDVLIGPIGAYNGAGCDMSGDFQDKMIFVQNLMDIDAFPWNADWYRTQVVKNQGFEHEKRFRLWFTDHAQHTSPSPSNTAAFARTIGYRGVIQQAVRDVSAWVEHGRRPPASTRYDVDDESQVNVPELALVRRGIQPTVHLFANGRERAEVAVDEPVTFLAFVTLPQGTGRIVDAEWDFLGVGDFPVVEDLHPRPLVFLLATHSYDEPGTYFPVLRATSQREGDPDTPFGRVQNLGRVRVVVE